MRRGNRTRQQGARSSPPTPASSALQAESQVDAQRGGGGVTAGAVTVPSAQPPAQPSAEPPTQPAAPSTGDAVVAPDVSTVHSHAPTATAASAGEDAAPAAGERGDSVGPSMSDSRDRMDDEVKGEAASSVPEEVGEMGRSVGGGGVEVEGDAAPLWGYSRAPGAHYSPGRGGRSLEVTSGTVGTPGAGTPVGGAHLSVGSSSPDSDRQGRHRQLRKQLRQKRPQGRGDGEGGQGRQVERKEVANRGSTSSSNTNTTTTASTTSNDTASSNSGSHALVVFASRGKTDNARYGDRQEGGRKVHIAVVTGNDTGIGGERGESNKALSSGGRMEVHVGRVRRVREGEGGSSENGRPEAASVDKKRARRGAALNNSFCVEETPPTEDAGERSADVADDTSAREGGASSDSGGTQGGVVAISEAVREEATQSNNALQRSSGERSSELSAAAEAAKSDEGPRQSCGQQSFEAPDGRSSGEGESSCALPPGPDLEKNPVLEVNRDDALQQNYGERGWEGKLEPPDGPAAAAADVADAPAGSGKGAACCGGAGSDCRCKEEPRHGAAAGFTRDEGSAGETNNCIVDVDVTERSNPDAAAGFTGGEGQTGGVVPLQGDIPDAVGSIPVTDRKGGQERDSRKRSGNHHLGIRLGVHGRQRRRSIAALSSGRQHPRTEREIAQDLEDREEGFGRGEGRGEGQGVRMYVGSDVEESRRGNHGEAVSALTVTGRATAQEKSRGRESRKGGRRRVTPLPPPAAAAAEGEEAAAASCGRNLVSDTAGSRKVQEVGARHGQRVRSVPQLQHSSQPSQPSAPPALHYPALLFSVDSFFAVGSPLGVFLALRNIRLGHSAGTDTCDSNEGEGQQHREGHRAASIVQPWTQEAGRGGGPSGHLPAVPAGAGEPVIQYEMPAVKHLFNVFHPHDPVAYRVEPLISSQFASIPPMLVPYHRGGYRLHIAVKKGIQQVHDTWHNMWTTLHQTATSLVTCFRGMFGFSSSASSNSRDGGGSSHRSSPASTLLSAQERKTMRQLTGSEEGRIDYMLQEPSFQHQYIQALSCHFSAWQDMDIVFFVIRHLYRNIPATPPPSSEVFNSFYAHPLFASRLHHTPIRCQQLLLAPGMPAPSSLASLSRRASLTDRPPLSSAKKRVVRTLPTVFSAHEEALLIPRLPSSPAGSFRGSGLALGSEKWQLLGENGQGRGCPPRSSQQERAERGGGAPLYPGIGWSSEGSVPYGGLSSEGSLEIDDEARYAMTREAMRDSMHQVGSPLLGMDVSKSVHLPQRDQMVSSKVIRRNRNKIVPRGIM